LWGLRGGGVCSLLTSRMASRSTVPFRKSTAVQLRKNLPLGTQGHYCVHSNLPLVPVVKQKNPGPQLPHYCFHPSISMLLPRVYINCIFYDKAANHSPPSSSEVASGWGNPSVSPLYLHRHVKG